MVAELVLQSGPHAWLTDADVIRADGAVMSWVNPDKPGYAYPEIAGYMLSYLALHGPETVGLRNRIAGRIARDLTPSGAVGRGGIEYVFDSSMALGGLLAHEARAGTLPDAQMIDRLYRFITSRLEARSGLDGTPDALPSHWSASYGAHLLKTVLSLTMFDERRPGADTSRLIDGLLVDLLPLQEQNGRFLVNSISDETYTHSHCYAMEALLVLDGRRWTSLDRYIERGADWLARVQLPSGGMPSRHTGAGAVGVPHADCTAQAMRVWECLDTDRYGDNIARGAEFLTSLQVGGGIRYREGSDDINTWATIFGAQALDWVDKGGKWQWLV